MESSYVLPEVAADDFVEVSPDYSEVSHSSFDISILFSEIKVDDAGEPWKLNRTRINLHPQNVLELHRQLVWALKSWREQNKDSLMEILENIEKLGQESSE